MGERVPTTARSSRRWMLADLAVAVALLLLPGEALHARNRLQSAEESYRQALEEIAEGRLVMAIGRVVASEEVRSDSCARAIELSIAEQLAKKDPEALVVQVFLRVNVQQARSPLRDRAGNLLALERSSVARIRNLGDLYVASSRDPEAPELMAGMLALLAHDLSRPRSQRRLSEARHLLERALELDATNVAALHSLGVTLELLGRPGRALPYLERLLALDPDPPPYRLRHALLLVKSGHLEAGERELEELTGLGPTWVRDLATQELARLVMAGGRFEEAENLLLRARQELPPEKLSLELATLLDLRRADTTKAMKAFPASPPGDKEPSSRWLYDLGPVDDILALERETSAAVSMRLGALGKALDRLPSLDRTPPGCR